jgi:hypothetical protein
MQRQQPTTIHMCVHLVPAASPLAHHRHAPVKPTSSQNNRSRARLCTLHSIMCTDMAVVYTIFLCCASCTLLLFEHMRAASTQHACAITSLPTQHMAAS